MAVECALDWMLGDTLSKECRFDYDLGYIVYSMQLPLIEQKQPRQQLASIFSKKKHIDA